MRRLLATGALIAALLSAPAASPRTVQFKPPGWLVQAERSLLVRVFGSANPQRIDYIPYRRKIAVVFIFRRVVICGACSSPSADSQPRGKVIRVSFDRRTHELGGASDGWAMQFCEVIGNGPPRSACLHH